jgi:hypothetical protein
MPVLAVVLTYVALLLFTYALGHSALVLIAGGSIGIAEAMVNSRGLKTVPNILKKTSGVLLLLVAAYSTYVLLQR